VYVYDRRFFIPPLQKLFAGDDVISFINANSYFPFKETDFEEEQEGVGGKGFRMGACVKKG
jgi:hypothetical protein